MWKEWRELWTLRINLSASVASAVCVLLRVFQRFGYTAFTFTAANRAKTTFALRKTADRNSAKNIFAFL